MSSIIDLLDRRNTQDTQQSLIFQQQHSSSSPIRSSSHPAQPQEMFWEEDSDDRINDSRYDSVPRNYSASPKPSTSQSSQEGTKSDIIAPEAPTTPTAKRRQSTLSLKSSTTNSTVKMPKAESLLGQNLKDSRAISHTVSPSSVVQHFPSHLKPTKHQSSATPALNSSFHPLPHPAAMSHDLVTCPVSPSIPMFARDTARLARASKLQRKRQLKNAKMDYEARVELFLRQLTEGCRRPNCTNRLCASRRGGIRHIHPQAALMMAMELASKESSPICLDERPMRTDTSAVAEVLISNDAPTAPKAFLHSLLMSPSFLSLFGLQPDAAKTRKHRSRPNVSQPMHERTQIQPGLWSGLGFMSTGLRQQNTVVRDSVPADTLSADDNDQSYYQLDSSSHSGSSDTGSTCSRSNDSVYESDTSDEGMMLAIRAETVNLASGTEQVAHLLDKGDPQNLSRWFRSIFQNWEGIGNSFLSTTTLTVESTQQHVAQVNLSDVNDFFHAAVGEQRCEIIEAISESLETLLDRMKLNTQSMAKIMSYSSPDHLQVMSEWCRAILCISEWIGFLTKSTLPKTHSACAKTWSDILSHKFLQVVSGIASCKCSLFRQMLKQHFSSMEAQRMTRLVKYLHQYLESHFHPGPYKQGEQDAVIMVAKCLELVFEANQYVPSSPVIPVSTFCSEVISKKINMKDEFRIWKRVLQHGEGRHTTSSIASSKATDVSHQCGLNEQQRQTRLLLTKSSTSTLLPFPFANEYQFSWFSYPFLLTPSIKRKILHMDAMSQMSVEYEDACVNHTLVVHAQRLLSDAPNLVRNLETNLKGATCPYLFLEIRRDQFIADTFHQVSRKWLYLKKPLKVKFVNGGEDGVDQGGVQKEFFGVLFEKLAAKGSGLFEVDKETRLCWIRPTSHPDLRTYEMTGVMMGLAIYNGVIMNLEFPSVLWKVLVQPSEEAADRLAETLWLPDLTDGWPSLAEGLRQLLEWPEGEDVLDVFCRNYEISMDIFGRGVVTVPLCENGEEVPVTNENRESFVRDYCKYFLYTAQRDQLLAIRRGLWSVIGGPAMDMCSAEILQLIACGEHNDVELNMKDLEHVAEYDDGYSAHHRTIRHFWSIVYNDMTTDQKRKLLFFVTASDRVPVGGLKELTFVIQRNGPDSDRLPTALTCFSRLLLPEYESKEKLRERLITAVENAKGFGLV